MASRNKRRRGGFEVEQPRRPSIFSGEPFPTMAEQMLAECLLNACDKIDRDQARRAEAVAAGDHALVARMDAARERAGERAWSAYARATRASAFR